MTRGALIRRLLARVLDDLCIASLAFVSFLGGSLVALLVTSDAQRDGEPIWASESDNSDFVYSLGILAAALIVGLLYEVITTAIGGGFGKYVCNLRVIDAESGTNVLARHALLRSAVILLPIVVLVILAILDVADDWLLKGAVAWRVTLGLTSLANEDRQGLHDRIVGSRVIAGNPS